MHKLSLFQAWSDWFSGIALDNFVLFGLRILWWGRIGKIAEFLAATTIAIEIIGPDRIRSFGASLHQESEKKPFQRLLDSPVLGIILIILTSSLLVSPFVIFHSEVEKMRADTRVLIGFLLILFLLIAALWLAMALFSAMEFLTRLADHVLKSVALALEFPAIDRVVRLLSLLLLLFGFHFDLLSS